MRHHLKEKGKQARQRSLANNRGRSARKYLPWTKKSDPAHSDRGAIVSEAADSGTSSVISPYFYISFSPYIPKHCHFVSSSTLKFDVAN